jgi:hypothetical protein
MTGYPHSGKPLSHSVHHGAEQRHKQIATRSMSSDQASSRGWAAGKLGGLQHHYDVAGRECDKDNAGHDS